MFAIFKNYKKQIWAILLVLLFIFANKLFPAQEIKSEDCKNDSCGGIIQDFNLSEVKKIYRENGVVDISSGDFFRFMFREKSDQDTTIYVKLSNPLGEEQVIAELDINESEEENMREIIFQAEEDFTDILFKKKYEDDSNVKLGGFRFTKLSINNEDDLKFFSSTIFGQFESKDLIQSQDKNNISFDQLVEPKTILGQVFQANSDFISEIEVDIDIVKQRGGNSDGTYQFIVRKADFEGGVPEIKNDELLNLTFSLDEIEKYREPSGKLKFPAYIRVRKGAYYFWGINNDEADPNRFNCLKIKGVKDGKNYQNGTVAIKKSGDSFSFVGDLYFLIYGAELKEYQANKMLLGSTIESVGKNKKIFKYQTSQKGYDLIDLDGFSGGVFFDQKDKSVGGINKKKSDDEKIIYKFEPPSKFKKFRIYAQQVNADWNQVGVLYSFDNKNWSEIDSRSSLFNNWQIFDQEIIARKSQKELYLKIRPLEVDSSDFSEKYGIANLAVEIDLIMQ